MWVWLVLAVVGVLVLLLRPLTRRWKIETRIARSAAQVFALHIDPVRFYAVLEMEKRNDLYRVLKVQRRDKVMWYELHHTLEGGRVIESRPTRFDIQEESHCFSEQFRALGTTFLFHWRHIESGNDACRVTLAVEISGPAILVFLFGYYAGGGVEKVWQSRFATTNAHLNRLIPK